MSSLLRHSAVFLGPLILVSSLLAVAPARWRTVTQQELRKLIPERAPVVKENIETEFRTASGVTDGRGKFIAGILMITAGYSAEGKYSHFFVTQVPLKIADFTLPRGEYVFGSQRVDNDNMEVKLYQAVTGKLIGSCNARKDTRRGPIRSFMINPVDKGAFTMYIGRFMFDGRLSE